MSFLNQLKSQARSLQSQRQTAEAGLQAHGQQTEAACTLAFSYLQDLARQLNVICPEGPAMSLDGKTPWPPMRLVDFRVDARRKSLHGSEAFDLVAMGWRIVPRDGTPARGVVRANFPPDLERVQDRLAMGPVRHDRIDIRSPGTNKLLAFEFHYDAETRGSVMVTPDHDAGKLRFRVLNSQGFGIIHATHATSEVDGDLLDELAKLIVGQPNRFH